MMHMSTRERVVGALRLPPRLKVLGWLATAVMTVCVASLAAVVLF
jgi:hypothetical protein